MPRPASGFAPSGQDKQYFFYNLGQFYNIWHVLIRLCMYIGCPGHGQFAYAIKKFFYYVADIPIYHTLMICLLETCRFNINSQDSQGQLLT